MLNIERVLREPRVLQALTGVSKAEFGRLGRRLDEVVTEQRAHRVYQNTPGAGRNPTLTTLPAKLFFILFYLKCYPTYDVAGVLFAVDRSRACRWVAEWLPLVEAALGREAAFPARQLHSVEDFLRRYPRIHDLYLDGTERPIQRPQEPGRQKEQYSGKKNATRLRT